MAITLDGQVKDLGGFSINRLLPHRQQRAVGPFVFLDVIGPAEFEPGHGVNVRPHPHIGLATVTYLTRGSILHRDSLGSVQEIVAGDVNWMTAGRGIVHSERETLEVRASRHQLHGFQFWVALPREQSEIEPSFHHVKAGQLPHIIQDNVMIRLIVGKHAGCESPITTHSPMIILDVVLAAKSRIDRPHTDWQVVACVIYGDLIVGEKCFAAGESVLLEADDAEIGASIDTRFLLFGGEPMAQVPHLFWNFVAFDKERIERAKQQWRDGDFPSVPGDDLERIPLP